MKRSTYTPWVQWKDVIGCYQNLEGNLDQPTKVELYEFLDSNGVLVKMNPPSYNNPYWSWLILAILPTPEISFSCYDSKDVAELDALHDALTTLATIRRYRSKGVKITSMTELNAHLAKIYS